MPTTPEMSEASPSPRQASSAGFFRFPFVGNPSPRRFRSRAMSGILFNFNENKEFQTKFDCSHSREQQSVGWHWPFISWIVFAAGYRIQHFFSPFSRSSRSISTDSRPTVRNGPESTVTIPAIPAPDSQCFGQHNGSATTLRPLFAY